jgi:hypothetical protein
VDRDGRVSLCILDEKWPLGYIQVYGTAAVCYDHELATDVLTRVIGIMAGEEVPESRRPQIEQMVDDEKRVVIRVTPHATFETPPRHAYQMSDIDRLTHHQHVHALVRQETPDDHRRAAGRRVRPGP